MSKTEDPRRKAAPQSLPEMRARQEELYDYYQGVLRTAESENRDLTQSEVADLDDIESGIRGLGDQIQLFESRADLDRSNLVVDGMSPYSNATRRDGPLEREQRVADWVAAHGGRDPGERGLAIGGVVRGLVTGKWDGYEREQRAMGGGAGSAGGFVVPSILAAEVIDLARNQTRVLQAGARTFPLGSDTVHVAKVAGDPQAQWRAEHGAIPEDDVTFGRVTFEPKSLAVITRLSRELLEDGQNVEQTVRSSIASSIAVELDRVALRGSGTDPEPVGVRNHPDVTVTELGSGDGATPTYDDLIDSIGRVQDNNHTPTNRIWAPRTDRTFAGLTDSNGQFLSPPALVASVPPLSTTQIPTDLTTGTSTDTSEIYTGDFSELYFGIRTELQLTLLTERYADSGQVGIVAWTRADMQLARAAAFDVITGVRP